MEEEIWGLGISELRRLGQLEEENSQLKKLVADLSLDKQILQDVLKKSSKASPKTWVATVIHDNYKVSLRRSCDLVRFFPSVSIGFCRFRMHRKN